jgi:hypothetical protein
MHTETPQNRTSRLIVLCKGRIDGLIEGWVLIVVDRPRLVLLRSYLQDHVCVDGGECFGLGQLSRPNHYEPCDVFDTHGVWLSSWLDAAGSMLLLLLLLARFAAAVVWWVWVYDGFRGAAWGEFYPSHSTLNSPSTSDTPPSVLPSLSLSPSLFLSFSLSL